MITYEYEELRVNFAKIEKKKFSTFIWREFAHRIIKRKVKNENKYGVLKIFRYGNYQSFSITKSKKNNEIIKKMQVLKMTNLKGTSEQLRQQKNFMQKLPFMISEIFIVGSKKEMKNVSQVKKKVTFKNQKKKIVVRGNKHAINFRKND